MPVYGRPSPKQNTWSLLGAWLQPTNNFKLSLPETETGGCTRECSFTQPCLTLCDTRDCSPPDSSVHGISHARILKWVVIFYSRGSSWPLSGTCVSWLSTSRVDSLPVGRFFICQPLGKFLRKALDQKLNTSAYTDYRWIVFNKKIMKKTWSDTHIFEVWNLESNGFSTLKVCKLLVLVCYVASVMSSSSQLYGP